MRTRKYEKGVRTIVPKENWPPVRFRVWLKVWVTIRVGGLFSSGKREIVLESTKLLFFKQDDTFEETKFWKVGFVTLKLYLTLLRSPRCVK